MNVDTLVIEARRLVMAQPLLFVLLIAVLLAGARPVAARKFFEQRRLAWGGAAALAVALAAVGASTIVRSSYDDHIEPSVVAVGVFAGLGHPAYAVGPDGPVYGLPYGPVLFTVAGWWAALAGATAHGAKVLAVLAALASLLVLGWRLASHRPTGRSWRSRQSRGFAWLLYRHNCSGRPWFWWRLSAWGTSRPRRDVSTGWPSRRWSLR